MDAVSRMLSLGCILAVVTHTPFVTGTKSARSKMPPGTLMLAKRAGGRAKLFFKGTALRKETVARRHQDLVLECEVGGSPSPTIHWLKDGERIQQGNTRDFRDDEVIYEKKLNAGYEVLRLGKVKSKLFLYCVTSSDTANYTCVAETPYERIIQSTEVKINPSLSLVTAEKCLPKKAFRGEPAKIYMWTAVRLEYEGAAVQLLCRAQGYPQPEITWRYGRMGDAIENDGLHEVLANGDLLISEINFDRNMGNYYCTAENEQGMDQVATFLYPTSPDDE